MTSKSRYDIRFLNTLTDTVRRTVRSALVDLRDGRRREAYALFLIGICLVILGLGNVIDQRLILSACLLAVTFIAFNTTSASTSRTRPLDEVLQNRQSFESFSTIVPAVRDLRVYGPTAVNVLVNIADIRRHVLDRSGKVRVIIQDPASPAMQYTAAQLDDNLDLITTAWASIHTLDLLCDVPGFDYKLLQFNPGFSLLIVDAPYSSGYVVFESHGFCDENIADRMHIKIAKQDSPCWFDYWVARYDALWRTARAP